MNFISKMKMTVFGNDPRGSPFEMDNFCPYCHPVEMLVIMGWPFSLQMLVQMFIYPWAFTMPSNSNVGICNT
jgi:hypothetical protein